MEKKKKYSLRKTWEYCLAMWKDVAEEWKKDKTKDICSLKVDWLRKHGFKELTLYCSACFFCYYEFAHKRTSTFNPENPCPKCPGVEVAPNFDCFNAGWDTDPVKFYRILKRMYTKWLKLHPKAH